MNGTIGHLRNVADLVAALNIEAILAEARLEDHELAPDLRAAVVMGYAALTKIAALVEEATAEEEGDAPSFTRQQVRDLYDEAVRAGDPKTFGACGQWLDDCEAGNRPADWAVEIIDEALSYARAMQ